MNRYFGSYKKSNINYLLKLIREYEKSVEKYVNYGKPFFKGSDDFHYIDYIRNCELNYESLNPKTVFEYISQLYQNVPNWINPGTMINVIPPVNLPALAGISFTNIFNPNFAEDHYCGRLLTAELEVSKYLSELIGWNWQKSHGLFTFGGKGTNLYATKIALNKADPGNINNGVSQNKYFMITSAKAHPCHYEVCNWLGIGVSNCIEAPCDENDCIIIDELKKIICENIEKGKILLGFNINGCSTVEYAVDPIKKIYELNEDIIKKYNLKYRPHIHVDAVIGWVWLFFNKYDFSANPCKFSKKVLSKIKNLTTKVSEMKYADSVGIDFHKTGFCPYVSSIFLVKNRDDYFTLNPKKYIAYEDYNLGNYAPFETSLELTRSSSGAIAALISLKTLGVMGFCKIIGTLLSSSNYFRKKLSENPSIEVINQDTDGLATLFIIKPTKYKNLTLDELKKLNEEQICEIKNYNIKYGEYIKELSLQGKINFTFTSSRSYVLKGTNIKIGALKIYPLSVFLTKAKSKFLLKEIIQNIDEFIKQEKNIQIKELKNSPEDMVYKEKNN